MIVMFRTGTIFLEQVAFAVELSYGDSSELELFFMDMVPLFNQQPTRCFHYNIFISFKSPDRSNSIRVHLAQSSQIW